MDKRRALILGATGTVGLPLTQALCGDGWTVFGAARMSDPESPDRLRQAGAEPIRFEVIEHDPATLPDVDVLFLEIWDPNQPDLIWPINLHGVGRVVERYRGKADVVNGCTIEVYGDSPELVTEETRCRPTSDYGRSRYSQERLIDYFCAAGGRRGIHVRYAHSNSADRGIIRRLADNILAGESLGSTPDARIQVIGIEDFVRVTVAALTRVTCPPCVVNCCHPRVWTHRELAQAIHDALGRGTIVFDVETGGLEQSSYADPSRMIEWFGEPSVSVEDLIRRAAEAAG